MSIIFQMQTQLVLTLLLVVIVAATTVSGRRTLHRVNRYRIPRRIPRRISSPR